MVIGKINTYHRTFIIFAGSLLALNVLIAIAAKTAGYSIVYTGGFAESTGTLVNYQVDTANTALAKDNFGMSAVSEKGDGCFLSCHTWHGIYDCNSMHSSS
mmetsp:Transcript_57150/g.63858  ORF Transcript_57150/g.63858 Transcript_57150/m.63858 type:complete len:101 (+) Transcript_57150:3-305(+)